MAEVIGVRFRGGPKEYYFDPRGIAVQPGCYVVVETAAGQEYARCVTGNHEVADEELVKRLTQRRSCPDCNAVYHLTNKPPAKEGICDKCGAKLYQRDDDKEATVRNRLEVYRKNTFPLIDYYEKRGKLVTIPGVGDINEIYAKIKKALLE